MTPPFGTRAWRDDALVNLGYDRAGHFREIILQALVLVEVPKEMAPNEITRSQAGLKAKPGSAFSVLTSARRVHARFCIQMAKSPLVHLVMKSLLKRYITNHGLHALLLKRKEPFTREMFVKILSLEPPTGKGDSYGPYDDARDFTVVLTLLNILAQTGMRLSELIGTENECRPSLCWDAFIYLTEDILMHSLDSEQATKMSADCCVLFKIGTSKADPTRSHWAPFPVYLPFRWGEPINAAKAIMDLDQIVRVPDADRKRHKGCFSDLPPNMMKPVANQAFGNKSSFWQQVKKNQKKHQKLFSEDGLYFWRQKIQKKSWRQITFCMVTAVGKDPKQFSFHSARIWLACALKEAGASNNRTQGMVCWLSEDSLRIYARDSRLTYAHWLDNAMHANVIRVKYFFGGSTSYLLNSGGSTFSKRYYLR